MSKCLFRILCSGRRTFSNWKSCLKDPKATGCEMLWQNKLSIFYRRTILKCDILYCLNCLFRFVKKKKKIRIHRTRIRLTYYTYKNWFQNHRSSARNVIIEFCWGYQGVYTCSKSFVFINSICNQLMETRPSIEPVNRGDQLRAFHLIQVNE